MRSADIPQVDKHRITNRTVQNYLTKIPSRDKSTKSPSDLDEKATLGFNPRFRRHRQGREAVRLWKQNLPHIDVSGRDLERVGRRSARFVGRPPGFAQLTTTNSSLQGTQQTDSPQNYVIFWCLTSSCCQHLSDREDNKH